MFSRLNNRMKAQKKSHGFSLVELLIVIVILAILAVAVFAGGSIAIKKAQVSQVTSDLHNFSIAIEATLNENPGVANVTEYKVTGKFDIKTVITKLNQNLPSDYQLTEEGTPADDAAVVTCKSAKKDAWDNEYKVVLDVQERNTGMSEFYITVISAGPDASSTPSGAIGADDIFLVGQYSSGGVVSRTYNAVESKPFASDGTSPATNYTGTASTCPAVLK